MSALDFARFMRESGMTPQEMEFVALLMDNAAMAARDARNSDGQYVWPNSVISEFGKEMWEISYAIPPVTRQ